MVKTIIILIFFDITKDLTKNYIYDIKDVIDFLEEVKECVK